MERSEQDTPPARPRPQVRRHERGMDRGAIHTHGYWKQGVANHPDHDLGQDV